jgi:FdhD protein
VTMRTPGNDDELAVGFLFTEGLVRARSDVAPRPIRELASARSNVVTVQLTRPFDVERLKRNFYATSSCGICGKAALEHIAADAPPIGGEGLRVAQTTLVRLPNALRAAQKIFDHTGGLHATGLFTTGGELLVVREDVGRHNAMDKVIGRLLLDGATPALERVLMVSGRASFELVQKAAMASVAVLCAVSAPSSLAVRTADRLGMTLVGFLRGSSFNVYTHHDRVDLEGATV